MFKASGKCSWFGGPIDENVRTDEGLAFISDVSHAPHLFLAKQPQGTVGLARRLNPAVDYIACRWVYRETPAFMLLGHMAMVRARRTNRVILAFPADWGPNEDTGRIADLSFGAMRKLGIQTDDIVDVVFPAIEGLLA